MIRASYFRTTARHRYRFHEEWSVESGNVICHPKKSCQGLSVTINNKRRSCASVAKLSAHFMLTGGPRGLSELKWDIWAGHIVTLRKEQFRVPHIYHHLHDIAGSLTLSVLKGRRFAVLSTGLPQGLRRVATRSPPRPSQHAPPYPDCRLVEAGFVVSTMTLYYAELSRCRGY
jgi:hypothetical protein